jgi:hypothetical protein
LLRGIFPRARRYTKERKFTGTHPARPRFFEKLKIFSEYHSFDVEGIIRSFRFELRTSYSSSALDTANLPPDKAPPGISRFWVQVPRNAVDVAAETLYEAVALGMATIRSDDWLAGIAQGLNPVRVRLTNVAVEKNKSDI